MLNFKILGLDTSNSIMYIDWGFCTTHLDIPVELINSKETTPDMLIAYINENAPSRPAMTEPSVALRDFLESEGCVIGPGLILHEYLDGDGNSASEIANAFSNSEHVETNDVEVF